MSIVQKEDLIQALLVEHLTEYAAAAKLGVHRNTIVRAKREYNINGKDWWKYQKIKCAHCGELIDPDVQLDEASRKKLIRKEKPLHEHCKKELTRKKDRDRQRAWRDRHRERYNEYMRRWRKENPERWREIKESFAQSR